MSLFPPGFYIFDFLRFLLSSFAFFRCCRFLEFQRYELARDGSEGAGINWDYFLKSYWRTRTLELLV